MALDLTVAPRDKQNVSRAALTLDDQQFSFRMAFTLAPTIEGVVLLFGFEAINPLWSCVFGIGGWTVEWFVSHHWSDPIHLFGLLVWPVAILGMLYALSGRVWRMKPPLRWLAIATYALTLCPIISVHRVDIFISGLPFFLHLWDY